MPILFWLLLLLFITRKVYPDWRRDKEAEKQYRLDWLAEAKAQTAFERRMAAEQVEIRKSQMRSEEKLSRILFILSGGKPDEYMSHEGADGDDGPNLSPAGSLGD